MLFLTASTIGILAGMTRSSVVMGAIGFLIAGAFAFASFFSPASAAGLAAAILGYNVGLMALVGGMTLMAAGHAA